MKRIVLFDKTTGEPVEFIEASSPSFAQLNGNREKYIAREISQGVNWQKARLNLDTGDVEVRPDALEMPPHILFPRRS